MGAVEGVTHPPFVGEGHRVTVAKRSVEEAIGPKGQGPPLVAFVGLGKFQDDHLAGGVHLVGVVGIHGKASNAGAVALGRGGDIVDKEVAVNGVVGVEGQAQEALFAPHHYPILDIDDRGGRQGTIGGNHPHSPPLLGDKQPLIAGMGQGHGLDQTAGVGH